MAVSGTGYSVDGMANTASLDIMVDGEVETTYSYGSGNYTLSERENEAVVSRAELARNYALIVHWRDQVGVFCSGFATSHVDNSLEIENEEDAVRYKMKVGAATVIDAEKDRATGAVTFAARPELTGNAYAFNRFVEAIRIILYGSY